MASAAGNHQLLQHYHWLLRSCCSRAVCYSPHQHPPCHTDGETNQTKNDPGHEYDQYYHPNVRRIVRTRRIDMGRIGVFREVETVENDGHALTNSIFIGSYQWVFESSTSFCQKVKWPEVITFSWNCDLWIMLALLQQQSSDKQLRQINNQDKSLSTLRGLLPGQGIDKGRKHK